MGIAQDPAADERPRGGGRPALRAAGYLLLFALGVLEGLIGSFQYGQPPTPLIAIVLVVIIFATCLTAGWGIGTASAGLLPAAGWIIASFVLAMPRPNGSVIITGTAAGEWYLYGGALASLAGAVAMFFVRVTRVVRPR
ncbi:MAG TPA: DUF6113 family protein [Trebonia sp.]